MIRKAERTALVAVEAFLGLTAVAGMVGLLAGWIAVPVEFLQGSPFADYTVPALCLGLLVGVPALLAAATVQRHHWSALLFSVAASVAIVVFELVEIAIIPWTWLQGAYIGVGLLILALTAALWAPAHVRVGGRQPSS